MRNALAFASLGLALGLAAHWAVAPERDAEAPPAASMQHAGHSPAHQHVTADRPAGAEPSADEPAAAEAAIDTAARPAEAFEESADLDPPIAPEAEHASRPIESPQQRIERLVAAGFDIDRATAIVQAESQQRLSAASAEYAATGSVRALSAAAGATASSLREQLGDADYERYLTATGQATRVVVGAVEPGSAAANAGLQTGDVIRAYGGRRVFGIRELNALMLDGAAGQAVPAEIVRDGQVLKLFVSGGPLGMAASSEIPPQGWGRSRPQDALRDEPSYSTIAPLVEYRTGHPNTKLPRPAFSAQNCCAAATCFSTPASFASSVSGVPCTGTTSSGASP